MHSGCKGAGAAAGYKYNGGGGGGVTVVVAAALIKPPPLTAAAMQVAVQASTSASARAGETKEGGVFTTKWALHPCHFALTHAPLGHEPLYPPINTRQASVARCDDVVACGVWRVTCGV